MTEDKSTRSRDNIKVIDFADYLKKLRRGARFRNLAKRSGVSERKLNELRKDKNEPLKYIDARKLCEASTKDLPLKIEHFNGWNIPDRERYETPLGQKVVASLLQEKQGLHDRLQEFGIAHNELNRIIGVNVKWSDSVKAKIAEAFNRGKIIITEADYEDQRVNRLKAQWLKAKDELEEKRKCEQAGLYIKSLERLGKSNA